MCKINKFIRRCASFLLACALFLSMDVTGTVLDSVIYALEAPPTGEGATFDFESNTEIDAQCMTVFFKHWRLGLANGETEVTAKSKTEMYATLDEYRFYPDPDGESVHLYKREGTENNADTEGKVFKYVQEFSIIDENGNLDYSLASFVISPQDNLKAEINEQFSNFNISSGHNCKEVVYAYDEDGNFNGDNFTKYDDYYGAVKYSDYPENYARLVVTYSPYNHLLKGHIFYTSLISTAHGIDFSEADENGYLHWSDDDEDYNFINPYWNANFENADGSNGKVVYTGEIDTYVYTCDETKNEYGDDRTVVFYDTSSGLHTNKTAYLVEDEYGNTDGRSYDLDLEAWYAADNLADIGLILDASGSMAWTTNAIAPLEVDASLIDGADGLPLNQFLTQKQLDKILMKQNTDNTRLSYAEYNYYIYDSRTDQAEFVPLAYWNGRYAENADFNLIGYYPFDGNLDNAVDEDETTKASLIKHAEDNGGVFEKANTKITLPAYKDGSLDLKTTAEKGAIMLDINLNNVLKADTSTEEALKANISPDDIPEYDSEIPEEELTTVMTEEELITVITEKELNEQAQPIADDEIMETAETNQAFSVSFKVAVKKNDFSDETTATTFDETPIMYIGNVDTELSSYYRIIRGNKRPNKDAKKGGASGKIRLYDNSTIQPSTADDNSAVNDDKSVIDVALFNSTNFYQCTFVFDGTTVKFYSNNTGATGKTEYADLNPLDFSKDIRIILGGNVCDGKDTYSDVYLKDVKIYNTALKGLNAADDEKEYLIGSYSLAGSEDSLKNTAGENASASYIAQFENGKFDSVSEGIKEIEISQELPAGMFSSESVRGKSLNLLNTAKNGAVLLDAVPTSNNFTVSFALWEDSGSKTSDNAILTQMLYAGDLDTSTGENYQVFRPGNSSANHLRMQKNADGNNIWNIKNYLSTSGFSKTWHYITCTFSDEKCTVYVDGEQKAGATDSTWEGNVSGLSTETISLVIAGLAKKYGQETNGTVYIDEMYVFDKALNEQQVKAMYDETEATKKNSEGRLVNRLAYDDKGIPIAAELKDALSTASLSDRQGWYYVNSHSVWNSVVDENIGTGKQFCGLIREVDSSGKVWDTKQITSANIPNAYANDEVFANSCSLSNESAVIFDSNTLGQTECASKFFIVEAPEVEQVTDENGKRHLQGTGKNAYYLRCYFNTGSNTSQGTSVKEARTQCSYVYYKPDSERVKRESLQYVISKFASQLHRQSSESRISAVRFSSSNILKTNQPSHSNGDLSQLVMMDWTKSTTRTGVVSARHGTAASSDTTAGHELWTDLDSNMNPNKLNPQYLELYNYGLTGGTYTYTGFQTFIKYLAPRVQRYDFNEETKKYEESKRKAKKYVILFTDGKDNDVKEASASDNYYTYTNTGNENAINLSSQLKADGYTVYCILFNSGSVIEGSSAYNATKSFLTDIAGTSKTGTNRDKQKDYVLEASSDEALVEAFQTILNKIIRDISGYTVQDYIDPRFDLVDIEGNTIKLGADGNIRVFDEDGTEQPYSLYNVNDADSPINGRRQNITQNTDGEEIETWTTENTLSDEIYFEYTPLYSPDGSAARLYYKRVDVDVGKPTDSGIVDMYYLQWLNQTIPSCEKRATNLNVWKATIRLHAKDDFIGGNSILTNGNMEGMNLVFHPLDEENPDAAQSSGVDEMTADIPSKGFPRTVVNVRLLPMTTAEIYDVSYMGEGVSSAELLSKVEREYISNYYIEYLKRYAYQRYQKQGEDKHDELDRPLIDLMNEWLDENGNDDEKIFSIPYTYLPCVEYDADTGKATLDENNNPIINNNTGNPETNHMDMVGILTYRWTKVEPEDADYKLKDYVKRNTERIKYTLTVEYTPLRDGDTNLTAIDFYEKIKESYNKVENGENIFGNFIGITISSVKPEDVPNYREVGRIDANNKALINEKDKDENSVYQWNPKYKPTPSLKNGDNNGNPTILQPENDLTLYLVEDYNDKDNDEINFPYYDSEEGGMPRTLQANAAYIRDVVSGGLALELRVPVKDLEEALDADGGFTSTFKVKATRKFEDTDYMQSVKANPGMSDYGNEFTLTFKFDYTAEEIEKLTNGLKEHEYVTVFASAKEITGTWIEVKAESAPIKKTETLKELPIGTYTINIDDITQTPKTNVIDFTILTGEDDKDAFKEKRDNKLLFDDVILNGLGTTNENPSRNTDNEPPEIYTPEIKESNIQDFLADFVNNKSNEVTFYIGTDNTNKHGTAIEPDLSNQKDSYIDDRLGIIVLTLGSNELSLKKIVENGDDEANAELWKFHIKLTSDTDFNESTEFTVKYTDAEGNEISLPADDYPEEYYFEEINLEPDAGNPVNGKYIYEADVYLKGGETITIKGLPSLDVKITYEITEMECVSRNENDNSVPKYEADKDYFVQMDKKASGTLLPGLSVIKCTNTFISNELPDLGGRGNIPWYVHAVYCFAAGSVLLCVYMLIKGNKRKRTH